MLHTVRYTRTSGCGAFVRLLSSVFLRSAVILSLALGAAVLPAQAQSEATAVLKGHVANVATGQFLRNAVVTIEGTRTLVRTADDGYFIITGLPAGTYNVQVSYVGLDTRVESVTLAAGEQKDINVDLTSEIYVLDEFVVASEREGSSKAVQEMRESNTIKNIVASDSFGNMVDGNIGELMKNLPGITIDYDGEDASAMRFRGMDPALMSVNMNGNPVATNPGGDSRSFSLKDFAVQNIEAIEVNFAPTPDQPSNNMGGSVNFRTKSAFNQKGRRIRLDGNMSLNSSSLEFQKTPGGSRTPDRKLMPGFNLSYSEAFGKEHPIGVSLNASLAQRYRFNNAYTLPSGYAYNDDLLKANGGFVSPEMQGTVDRVRWEERGQSNERRYIALNLDFKLFENTTLFLYSSYTGDKGLGDYRHTFMVDAAASQSEGANFQTMISPSGTTLSASSAVSTNNTKTYNLNPGVKHRFGDFELNYDAFIMQSKYDPDPSTNYTVNYSMTGVGLTIEDLSGNATGRIHQTLGADYTNLANYSSVSLVQNYVTGTDTQKGAKIDGRLPLELFGMPVILQAGGRVNQQERDIATYYREKRMTGNSSNSSYGLASEPKIAQFADGYFANKWNFDVPVATWVSPYAVYDYNVSNPDKFWVNDAVINSQGTVDLSCQYVREREGLRFTRERVWAGYAMATVNPFKSLSVVGGVRYEFTDLYGTGWRCNGSNYIFAAGKTFDHVTPTSVYYGWSNEQLIDLVLEKQTRSVKYQKVFPNLQAKWEPLKNLIFRAAYTTNMGRPNLAYIMPGGGGDERLYETADMRVIRRKNTALKPQEGENFDFKVEYYLPRQGVVGLSAFHQKIKNYIAYVTTYENRLDEESGDMEAWQVVTSKNLGNGTNNGFEATYRQRLGFVASFLKDFELYTAFSMADPTFKYRDRVGFTGTYNMNQEEYEQYMQIPLTWVKADMSNVIKKSGNVRLSYTGRKFEASVGAFWRDEFTRSYNTTNHEENKQASDLRIDLSATYKMSTHWKAYLDWRNATNVADERSVYDRTGGYYESGMAINLGIRADL